MSPDAHEAKTIRQLIDQAGLTLQVERSVRPRPTPTDRVGRYPITGVLGEGGMGQVLRVRDEDIGREMAVKVIRGQASPQMLAKFVREAQITGTLEHPNIVPMHELGMTDEGQIYFTMKRIDGEDLEHLLAASRKGTGPTLFEYLQIFGKVCDAIAFAHERGVIHRDLKPANIMVGRFGEVQVMDWGLARMMGQTDPTSESCRLALGDEPLIGVGGLAQPVVTLDGTVVGTPHYMSPEQARGEVTHLDRRSDIYSLGAILYEVLTFETPFDGRSGREVIDKVIEGSLIPPCERTAEREISPELQAVVLKAMSPTPAQRYDTVTEMQQEIEAFLAGRLLQTVDYSLWQIVQKWAKRNKPKVIGAAGLLAGLIVTLVGLGWELKQVKLAQAKVEKANQQQADEHKKLKVKTDEFDQLADVQNLRELLATADKLWPRRPEKIPEYESWLESATRLSHRVDAHQSTRERLLGAKNATQAQKVLVTELTELVGQITTLRGGQSHGNTIADVRDRLEFSRELRRRRASDRGLWDRAITAISKAPIYKGLVIQPVDGLVPLGPDPASRLWEFAHLGSGKSATRNEEGQLVITEGTTEGTGLVLVLVPPGRFMMGAQRRHATNQDKQAKPREEPVHPVLLAAFYISKFEMTQAQWRRVTGNNPSMIRPPKIHAGQRITERNPVEQVSWNDCRRVVEQLGLQLPTEAQWEYAARAGTRTVWPYGNSLTDLLGNANIADRTVPRLLRMRVANPEVDDKHLKHAPVGSFPANRWGLYDVVGNVWEWCRDSLIPYHAAPPRPGDGLRDHPVRRAADPPENAIHQKRVLRGGSMLNPAEDGRSAHRFYYGKVIRHYTVALRPVLGTTRDD